MSLENKPRIMVADSEREKIDRNVLIWLNTYPEKPADVTVGSQLGVNVPGLGVSPITSAYINKHYIYGGYEAEYQFTLIYRIKPGGSPDKSLQANELLNRMGDWARRNKPYLGDEIRVEKVELISVAQLYAPYEDGDEDHHIPIKITYEVIQK